MNYKMVCIDMDGTLIGKKRNISQKSKEVIKKAHEEGIEIVVTTGRIYNNAAYFSHLLGVKSPVIAANGAIVREKDNDNIIYEGVIPTKTCLDIIEILNRYKVQFQFYTTDTIYCSNFITKVVSKIFMTKQIGYEMLKVKYVMIKTLEEWKSILEKNGGKIAKCITLSIKPEKMVRVKKELSEMRDVSIYGSGRRSIEINYKEVSKGNAVRILGEYYGISADEIMCIGDNENDISMIEYAGLGVAMGNAIEAVKLVADYVTDTNKDDGVAKAMQKFIIDKAHENK